MKPRLITKSYIDTLAGLIAVLTLLAMGITSPAHAERKKTVKVQAAPSVDINTLVWPPAPDVTRIRYLSTYSGEADFTGAPVKKKKASWLDHMAGVSLPQEEGKPKLHKPYGVVSDSKGLIYVADSSQGVIFVFDTEARKMQYRGQQSLVAPSGMAIDDTDRLFVADAVQHSVFVFRPDGSIEGAFGTDRLTRPIGLAVDNDNRYVYVVDPGENRLVVFDADTLKFIRYLGKASDENMLPGTFGSPTNAAVNSEGNVYVTDTFNSRVQVFNAFGEFVTMWGKPGSTPGNFMRPKGIAIDKDDHVYVVDAEFNNVQIFDNEGHVLMYFGDRGETPGSFMLATGIGIDRRNRIFVTEQWTGRLQVFRYVTDEEAAPLYAKRAQELERAQKESEESAK